MNALPYRTSEITDSGPVDRSFGNKQTQSRLQFDTKNEHLISSNLNVNVLGNSFRMKPVIYDMDDDKERQRTSINNVHKKKIYMDSGQQQPQQQQNEKFDLGTLVLSKIIEQMKSLNSSVNATTTVYDKNVSIRAGLPLYTDFLNETNTKEARHGKEKIYGTRKTNRDKKTRYTIPTYIN